MREEIQEIKNQKEKVKEINKWITEQRLSFGKATEHKGITTFMHCKNCLTIYGDTHDKLKINARKNPMMFYLEAGWVGSSKSLIRIQCPNCKKTIMDINLLQTQIDALKHFLGGEEEQSNADDKKSLSIFPPNEDMYEDKVEDITGDIAYKLCLKYGLCLRCGKKIKIGIFFKDSKVGACIECADKLSKKFPNEHPEGYREIVDRVLKTGKSETI